MKILAPLKMTWLRYSTTYSLSSSLWKVTLWVVPFVVCLVAWQGYLHLHQIYQALSLNGPHLLNHSFWHTLHVYGGAIFDPIFIILMLKKLKEHTITNNVDPQEFDELLLEKIQDEQEKEKFQIAITQRHTLRQQVQEVALQKPHVVFPKRKM